MRYHTVTIEFTARTSYADRMAGKFPEQRTARVRIEIDEESIIEQIGSKAARSKTGRSTAYGRAIKAKVLKG